MTYRSSIASILFMLAIFAAPFAFADSFSASIQNLSPGNSVMVKNRISFTIAATGFQAQSFQVQDSFSGSSLSDTSKTYVDGGGNFQWIPLINDVGTHNLTITARDFNGDSASTQLTVIVLPPPTVSISNVSAAAIAIGQTLTFSVSQNGFTNPSYIVGDDFSGSSITNQNISTTGNFSWKPDYSQNGKHRITVYATDSQSHQAQASVDVQVGQGPTLMMQPVSPGTTIQAGQTVSFTVAAMNFIPTGFSLSDSFSGGTITNANINTAGNFVWTPSGSDVGTHTLLIKGQVGAFGDSATTSQTLYVVAMGASTSTPPATTASTASNTATASSSTLILLKAQLAALQAKLASGVSSNTSSDTSMSGGFQFTSYLKPGMRGDEVLQLQKVLAGLGLLTATPNGYYGVGTTAAVEAFQKAHGLERLGVVGPGTRAALNALGDTSSNTWATPATASASNYTFEHFMGYGDDDSPDVTQLQTYLQSLGYLSRSAPLGFYGSATEQAVKKFQSSKGLPSTGYVDTATRAVLNK